MVVNQFLLDTNIILYLLGGRLAKPLPEGNYYVSVRVIHWMQIS